MSEQLELLIDYAERLRAKGKLTPEMLDEIEAIADEVEREQASKSLHAFCRQAWPIIEPGKAFIDNWHIGAICEHLEAVSRGEITRLLINVPYRTSKSSIVSVMWPAWDWARKPSRQWLTLSHAEKLAIRDTRKMRVLVQSEWFQSRWELTFSKDQNEKKRFENDQLGYRIAAGVTSGVTGEGGDIIIVDDPADRDEAQSDLHRQRIIDEFDEKISTRLNDPSRSSIVIIGQRLHEQDLFGHLIEQGGWEHLCVPMLYEVDHPHPTRTSLGWTDPRTEEGELMWPERFPESVIEQEQKLAYKFAGQMQQRPVPKGGGMFQREWFGFGAVPEGARYCRYWDKAGTEGAGDYSAGVLVAEHERRFFIVDVVRGQWSSHTRNAIIRQTADMDVERYGKSNVQIIVEQEPGSSGKESAEISVRELAGYRVKIDKVTGAKEVRAQPLADQCEAGNVKLVRGAWNTDYLQEICSFPYGKHDDQVDGSSGAFNALAIKRRPNYGDVDVSKLGPNTKFMEQLQKSTEERLDQLRRMLP